MRIFANNFRFFVLIFCCMGFISCSSSDDESSGQPPGGQGNFTGQDALVSYLKTHYANSLIPQKLYYAGDSQWEAPSTGGEADGFTLTNVQEEGVDEPDKVKTNGEYICIAGKKKISIVDVTNPEQMAVIGEHSFPGEVNSLFLSGNVLVVLYTPQAGEGEIWRGTDLTGEGPVGMPYWIPVLAKTGIALLDITLPSEPIVLNHLVADGSFVDARLVNGYLHVVQQYMPDLPPLNLYYDGTQEDYQKKLAENQDQLAGLSYGDMVPQYTHFDEKGTILEQGPLVDPSRFVRPDSPQGGTMVTITSYDLKNPLADFRSTGLVADAHVVYASPVSLYLISTVWADEEEDGKDTSSTILHKFQMENLNADYRGKGEVPGAILNRFSCGEYQDVMRIATTTGRKWSAPSELKNNIYCLMENQGRIEIIGKIEGIAPEEAIYSARFIGDKGFLVTFEVIDPLFTVDLSDAYNPTIIGELKVPGYSSYIHPYKENLLITLGKDVKVVDKGVWDQGVQLSMFDVSVFDTPALLNKLVIGDRGTESLALYEHRAFTFWESEGLLAIPIELYVYETPPENPWEYGTYRFSGLYVLSVVQNQGFTFLGGIPSPDDGEGSYYDNWTRGVFIGDFVFSARQRSISSAPVDSLNNINHLSLQ